MAKPQRGRRSNRKMSLKDRWTFTAWVCIDTTTDEHVVVLGHERGEEDRGRALRERTVLRRAASDRWNPEAIKAVKATPRTPKTKDRDPDRSQPERQRRTSKIELDGDVVDITMDHGTDERARVRNFKIMKGILDKFGFSSNCTAFDASLNGAGARMHSDVRGKRPEEVIKNGDIFKVKLDMWDIRFNRRRMMVG